jgi:hypothetical protein
VRLAVNLYENFVHMPLPVGVCAHLLDAFSTDLSRKHRTKSVPPKPDGFVADINATFVQQILYVPKPKGEPYIEHYRQANDLGGCLEVAKWTAFYHPTNLDGRPARLNQVSSDSTEPWALSIWQLLRCVSQLPTG